MHAGTPFSTSFQKKSQSSFRRWRQTHLSSDLPLETDFSHKQVLSLEFERRICWLESLWGKESARESREGRREELWRLGHIYSDVEALMLINGHCSCHINQINKHQTKAGVRSSFTNPEMKSSTQERDRLRWQSVTGAANIRLESFQTFLELSGLHTISSWTSSRITIQVENKKKQSFLAFCKKIDQKLSVMHNFWLAV